MIKHYDGTYDYEKGIEAYTNKDYLGTINYLEKAMNDPKYKKLAIPRIVKMEFMKSNYKHARELLETYREYSFFGLHAQLEQIEQNYQASIEYYQQSLQDPNWQIPNLLGLARVYVQTGDNDIARKILETLKRNEKIFYGAMVELIYLDLLEKDYQQAYDKINLFDYNKLSKDQLYIIQELIQIILNKTETSQPTNGIRFFKNSYMMNRLQSDDNRVLIDHIQKHTNQSEKDTNGCFFKYTDLKMLLEEIKSVIDELNPNYSVINSVYRFRLNDPIGFKKGQITNDICVITVLGTQRIITMYPITLSDQFDQEGMSKNLELRNKRNSWRR